MMHSLLVEGYSGLVSGGSSWREVGVVDSRDDFASSWVGVTDMLVVRVGLTMLQLRCGVGQDGSLESREENTERSKYS